MIKFNLHRCFGRNAVLEVVWFYKKQQRSNHIGFPTGPDKVDAKTRAISLYIKAFYWSMY